MKARKSLGKWLVAALVAAAGMVLLGCPHNNLIDGGGTEGAAGAGRGGSGEVRLIVTNFASDKGASRSSSWLGGPQKTISPDHINLKDQKDDYVFVAEGESNQGETYGPAYITLEDDGSTSLGIAGGGIWSVTVSAYSVAKLNGLGMGADATTIMGAKPASEVKRDGDDTALVLRGKATLDLGMNSTGSVTVTLTNDSVGTEGNVLVTVNFDNTEFTKLNTATYKVHFGLYNFETGELVKTTGGGNAEEEVEGNNLTDAEAVNIPNVPKGRYQFRVTVKDANSGDAVAYWADEIYVEGNRDTTQEVHVSGLFDPVEKPTKAGVYWSRKDSGETRDGFLGYLSWEDVPFNAVGMDVQIADITKWYKLDAGTNDQIDFTGTNAETFTDAATLWQKIDALPKAGAGAGTQPTFEQVVTELKWNDSPQKATSYPAIYKEGSLLNGSAGIVLLMQSGQVYTVRVRAASATSTSDWLPIDQTSKGQMAAKPQVIAGVPATVLPAGTQEASDFNNAKLGKGIFDLVMLKYDLEGKYELAKTNAGPTKGDKAAESDLVVYSPYGNAIDIALKYENMSAPKENDWFLYPLSAGDISNRSMGWKGWKGVEDPSKEFNATVGQATTNWVPTMATLT